MSVRAVTPPGLRPTLRPRADLKHSIDQCHMSSLSKYSNTETLPAPPESSCALPGQAFYHSGLACHSPAADSAWLPVFLEESAHPSWSSRALTEASSHPLPPPPTSPAVHGHQTHWPLCSSTVPSWFLLHPCSLCWSSALTFLWQVQPCHPKHSSNVKCHLLGKAFPCHPI